MRKQLFRILILNEISRLLSRNKFLISLRTNATEFSVFQSLINRILQLIKGRIKLDAKNFSPRKREREKEKRKMESKKKK